MYLMHNQYVVDWSVSNGEFKESVMIGQKQSLPWLLFGEIDKGSNDTGKVANANLHGDAYTSLETASNIVAIPCPKKWYGWVDAWSNLE